MIKNIDLQNDCLNLTSTNNIHVCFLFASASAVGPGLTVMMSATVMHPLCTQSVRISYALPIKHPYTVISSPYKVLNCTKPFKRINFPPFTIYQSATYTSNKRSMSVIP